MNDKSAQVLEQYDIVPEKIRRGRGFLIVETKENVYRLMEYRGSVVRLTYEEALLQHIEQQGDIQVSTLVRNKENQLFSNDNYGDKFVVTRYFSGNDCDVQNKNSVNEAVRTLAHLHNITEHVPLEHLEYVPVLSGHLEEISRHNRELKRIRKYLRQKKQKTEFEYDVLNHFEEFYELAIDTEELLKSSGYEEESQRAVERCSICHGCYNYHNILSLRDGMAVLNFEHSGRGLLIRDLYFFLRKVLEKHDWNTALGAGLIQQYHKIRPILPEEKVILKCLLSYPEKFWKVLNHYYNGNKVYLPEQMHDKMRKVYVQQKEKQNFIKYLET